MVEVIPHWLDKQAELSPHETAIEIPNQHVVTFHQLRDESRRFARKLSNKGVSEGDHVAIHSNNSLDMVLGLHALSYLGAVAILLNTRLSETELTYQLTDANVSLVLTSVEAKQFIATVNQSYQICTFEQVHLHNELAISLKKELNLDELFTIIYTSGTTGFPKGVQHTYGNHWWSAISSALNLGLDHNDKWLVALPLFHVGGLSILIKSVIYGMPVYLMEKFDVEQVDQGIKIDGVTIVSVVSVMLERLIDKLGESKYPASFRCMLLGGGPASQTLLERAKKNDIPVFQTYGMTETSSQIATLSQKYALTKIGSAGKSLFPAQLRIWKNGKIAVESEVGEIQVKGPMVSRGYYNNEIANQKTFENDWLKTGDLGYLDQEGFLYVIDRRKDLIISGGENVYPAEIEGVLAAVPGIKEVGVIGKQDDEWGQIPVAFVVRINKELSIEEILTYCRKHLAKYKIPKEIYFVPSLPRNASSKLVRYKLEGLLKK
ncbi:o-succinylbenzoate--CoA ligase [Aquibacillus halophilus]|uniref:2-succinylbenzoate--CoA ligase n=1 Tax=Aquibacillus halophilus TaxID=930132 RepID=A0A6A8DGJ8_9BACI|nr:o-succinylbenzoate--CoA ligase [Aquibacillus halophilus]MRH44784.1 o-succinylbenzoate--CoA ligase [Aquibacillus halophilus]